jgi:hypothetical protein
MKQIFCSEVFVFIVGVLACAFLLLNELAITQSTLNSIL